MRLVIRWAVACLVCVALATPAGVRAEGRGGPGFRGLEPVERDARARHDARLLASYARGIDHLLGQLKRHHRLFGRDAKVPLSPDERRLSLTLFEQVLSYSVGLDQIASFHFEFWRYDLVRNPVRHARHFALAFAAYCLKVRLGLAFIDRTINKRQFEKLLDEGSPEHGLPSGAYGRLKWNVVHVEAMSKVMTAHQYHKVLRKTVYKKFDGAGSMPEVLRILDGAYGRVKSRVVMSGVKLFGGNSVDIVKDSGQKVWFPVQMGVAEWMGDTKVRRLQTMLIGEQQIDEAIHLSQPGDILVERRNWYLSNIALPGFWPHAALWVGTPDDMKKFFDGDPAVRAAYGGSFTAVLAERFPKAWAQLNSLEEGHVRRILEAMSEGVVFTSAEHSVRADYVAAMRPRLSRLEIARAIERAFAYAGRPYDFDFDFYTDTSLVCSELIYKAYEPRQDARGLTFALEEIAGRMTLGPNTMVRQFARDFGTPRQQLDFVWFLDGREETRSAVWSSEASFRASHHRLKWDISQK